MSRVPRHRSRLGLAGTVLIAVVGACGGGPTSSVAPSPGAADPSSPPASPTAGPQTWRLGLSNSVAGDPWRTAMVCTAKAQARISERVDRLLLADRGTDAAGQAADLRNLVATGVDAVVIAPHDPAALEEAVAEAVAAGVVVVAVGRAIAVDGTYAIVTDQEAVGSAGATWLITKLEGTGRVVYVRGGPDDAIDEARDAGVRRTFEGAPDMEIVAEIATDGDPAQAVEGLNALIADTQRIDAVLTTGPDSVIVDALKAADEDLVPIVGGDRGAFVSQLLTEEGLVGAVVTDPPAVGGAAVALALAVLDGDPPAEPIVRIEPEVWANDSDEGRARLAEADDPEIELGWPLSLTLRDGTDYEVADAVACQGPGG